MLPGRYTIQVLPADPLFAATPAAPAQVVVPATADQRGHPGRLAAARADPAPKSSTRVDEQVSAFLTACAKQETLSPAGCPFQMPGIVIGEVDVRWRIDQVPVIEVVPADEPGPPIRRRAVRTVTPGRVTATYAAFTSGRRRPQHRHLAAARRVTGTVDVDQAQPGRVVWNG
jgi:hypothetical protein